MGATKVFVGDRSDVHHTIYKVDRLRKLYTLDKKDGPVINEQDLIEALNQEIISCAALDVYDQEPLPADHILRKTKNTILTPHIGYVSKEAYEKFFNGYLIAIEGFLKGEPINQIK